MQNPTLGACAPAIACLRSRAANWPDVCRPACASNAAVQLEQEEAEQKDDRAEEEGEDEADQATVHTYKKSQYWSKEVEEKLGLNGADPYGLLELEDKRWRATADEIRKAYRRLVLTMHPDKKASANATEDEGSKPKAAAKKDKATKQGGDGGDGDGVEGQGEEEEEEEEEEDAEFKLLSAAWDLLGNPETRRAYDSIDNFNDYLPVTFSKRSTRNFYQTFRAPFGRQSKFSTVSRVPQLGDEETPYEAVQAFYKFWFSFSSWRDFSLHAEHELKEAEDREERRWMQRQNKNFTDRLKKDERARVQAFVQVRLVAASSPPRPRRVPAAFPPLAGAEAACVRVVVPTPCTRLAREGRAHGLACAPPACRRRVAAGAPGRRRPPAPPACAARLRRPLAP